MGDGQASLVDTLNIHRACARIALVHMCRVVRYISSSVGDRELMADTSTILSHLRGTVGLVFRVKTVGSNRV